jgi:hypothetical protein
MNIPNVPDSRVIDEHGYMTKEWNVFFVDLVHAFRTEVKPLSLTLEKSNKFI